MPNPGPDDWRRMGQERYLVGAQFAWAGYRDPKTDRDHDHCEFCWQTFMERPTERAITEGYRTRIGEVERWVCPSCFEDFREEFRFTVSEDSPPPGDAGAHPTDSS